MEKEILKNQVLLGCVADDFTGASDAASFLAGQGLKTLLFNGVPSDTDALESCDAIVIATKVRSIAAEDAVAETKAAFAWLQAAGVQQFYYKYCSTFDSTPRGNIGPITDMGLAFFDEKYTILCPALPVNGRTVKDGILYVNGVPLAESPMKNHPLNPMWDSRLAVLMQAQAQYDSLVLGTEDFALTDAEILQKVADFGKTREHFYIIPDYKTEEDGAKIARLFGSVSFLTGGSGILAHMADRYLQQKPAASAEKMPQGTKGAALLIAGSCSKATGEQIRKYLTIGSGKPLFTPELLSGKENAKTLYSAETGGKRPILFYSAGSTDPELRKYASDEQRDAAAAALEKTFADIAEMARKNGVTRFIIAGGETSGSVALKLGFDGYLIGESVAPGVPVMTPLSDRNVRVVYKSGNFGDEDFFEKALKMTEKE